MPKCSETGEFLPMQCSNNKDLCWCVDKKGLMIDNTMKASKEVQCKLHDEGILLSTSSQLKDINIINALHSFLWISETEKPLSDRASAKKKNPCKIGLPLVDKKTGEVVMCGTQNCPGTYDCKKVIPDVADSSMVCCATAESIGE